MEEKARARMESVIQGAGGTTVEEQVWGAVEMTLGVDRESIGGVGTRRPSFLQLGGDSISAVRLVEHVERMTSGVRLPVSAVLNPTSSIDSLCNLVAELKKQQQEGGGSKGPQQVDVVKISDLTLDKFFTEETLEAAKDIYKKGVPSTAKNVLLTGANGFLGRFLALEVLKRVTPSGGRLYCLVRAQSDEQAHERMMQAYETSDGKLQKLVEGYGPQLQVLAGE